jgi:hypothetical protein
LGGSDPQAAARWTLRFVQKHLSGISQPRDPDDRQRTFDAPSVLACTGLL